MRRVGSETRWSGQAHDVIHSQLDVTVGVVMLVAVGGDEGSWGLVVVGVV